MQSVQFIKPWKIYSSGDVAGFEPGQAKRLIDGKVAESYGAPAVAPDVEPKPVESEVKPPKAAK
jgi:hypothetical protein